MPGSQCVVVTCENSFLKNKTLSDCEKIKFYNFPKDIDQKYLWKKLCRRDSSFVVKPNTKICEEHFIKEARHTLKCKLLGSNVDKRCKCSLKKGTLPSLKLPRESMTWLEGKLPRDKRKQQRDQQKLVQELLAATTSNPIPSVQGPPEPVTCVLVNDTYPEEEDLQVFSESEPESEPESEVDLVEDEPSVFQLEDLCRVCALAGGDMVGVFSTDGLLSKVSLCLPVKVEEGDQLPANVCRSCLNRIEDSFCLANMALKSDASLREMLQQQETLFKDNQQPDTQDFPDDIQDFHDEAPVFMDSVSVFDSSNEEIGVSDQFSQNVEQFHVYPEAIFMCHICEDSFDTRQELINHRDQEHKFLCCGSSEEDKIEIEVAKQKSIKLDIPSNKATKRTAKTGKVLKYPKYKCTICSETFPNKVMFKRHYSEVHSQIICAVGDCSVYFVNKIELRNHYANVHKKIKVRKTYVCEQCSKQYQAKWLLAYHIYYDHEGNEGKFKCNLCETRVRSKAILKHHLLTHGGERNFECLQCNKKFLTIRTLKLHQKTHEQERKFICNICDSKFKTKKHRDRHINYVHTENWVYNCNICSTSFKSDAEKLKHSNEHEKSAGKIESLFSKVSKHHCEICFKFYANEYKLIDHRKICHGTAKKKRAKSICYKTFECNFCLKIFKSKLQLQSHLGTHLLIKPFQCLYCDKSFCTNAALIIHTRLHTNETPFSCNLCEKSFRSKRILNIHIQQVHEKVRNFQCYDCNKKFFQKSHLIIHIRTHTNERPYMCDVCSQQFKQMGDLKSHLKRHGNN